MTRNTTPPSYHHGAGFPDRPHRRATRSLALTVGLGLMLGLVLGADSAVAQSGAVVGQVIYQDGAPFSFADVFLEAETGVFNENNRLLTSNALPLNRFTYVVATYDGLTKRIYLDGRLDVSRPRKPTSILPICK